MDFDMKIWISQKKIVPLQINWINFGIMKLRQFILLGLLASLTSCWTLIATVVPHDVPVVSGHTVYTTQVTPPASKYVTTTSMTVTSYNTDLSFYLDLQAVAAAFAESKSVQEFEMLLNSSRYMINNLDLNGDGYIDYLRVLETRQGYYHAFVIQACLAPSYFQDVATLVAERRANSLYVEVIGDPYLYGYYYIVRPTFVSRPPLWDAFGRPNYAPWHSPYHHGHWPSHYHPTKPIYLTHYQAYVNTYMSNHHYCRVCDYPTHVFYKGYDDMVRPDRRNDHRNQHPNTSFEHRVNTNAESRNIRNAADLRNATQPRVSEPETRNNTTTSKTPAASTPSRTNQTTSTKTTHTTTTTRQDQTATATRQNQTTSSTSRTTSATVKADNKTRVSTSVTTPSTSVETKVNKSGAARTTVKTVNSNSPTRVSTTNNTTRTATTTTTATERTTTRTSSGQTSRTGNASSSEARR